MTVCKRNTLPRWLLAVVLVSSQAALGGTAEVTNAKGDTMRFEYRDNNLRIGMDEKGSSYMIVRDDNLYMVNDSDGNLMVIDARQAWNMVGGLAGSAAPEMVADEVISLEATGATEEHAGIEGEVYRLRYRGDEGVEREAELVLSDDPRARAFRDAMHRFAVTMAATVGEDYDTTSADMQGRLAAMDKGVLRYGDDMAVSALSADTIDPARFELPAEPMDMSNIGALFGQGQSKPADDGSRSGDGLSGLFGASADRDAEQEDSANNDNAGGPASASEKLSEAFGRMFGK